MTRAKAIRHFPRGNRKQWLKVSLLVVPVLSLLAYGSYALWQSALKWVEESSMAVLTSIEIQGNALVTEHEILEVAEVPMGANLMRLSLDSVAIRVTGLERVHIARAIRRIPGRLILEVKEREPLGAIVGGELLLTDATGTIFHPVYGLETIDLPVLTGSKLVERSAGFQKAISLLSEAKDNYPLLYESIGEINVGDEAIEMLRLRQGGAKVLVEHELDDEALKSLEIFLDQKGSDLTTTTQYVDLRMPGMVITGSDPG